MKTRKPNETLKHFQARLGVLTIQERARKVALSASLIKAATEHPNQGTDCDLWAAIHRAAAEVVDEAFWIGEAKGAQALAPTCDDETLLQQAREEASRG